MKHTHSTNQSTRPKERTLLYYIIEYTLDIIYIYIYYIYIYILLYRLFALYIFVHQSSWLHHIKMVNPIHIIASSCEVSNAQHLNLVNKSRYAQVQTM